MTRVTADAIDLADPALDRADDDALPAGALAGSWRIEHAIATGGYGRVYAARHHVLDGRRAAIKVLHRACAAQPATARRFLDEARVVSRLRHPAIVEVIDVGYLADRRPWIAMELLAEHNLAHRLAAAGALTLDEAIALVAPVAGALDAVHAAGLVHRDVTAHNLGFATGASTGAATGAATDASIDAPATRIKLFDFGIAKATAPGEPAIATRRLGTPCAMAPEQIRGEPIDGRADVYALGVLVFQLVTGRPPFGGDDPQDDPREIERMHLETPPPRPSAWAPVPAALDGAIARAMAKRPADRPPTAPAFVGELRRAAGGAP